MFKKLKDYYQANKDSIKNTLIFSLAFTLIAMTKMNSELFEELERVHDETIDNK